MLVGIIGAMDLEVQALKGLMDNAVVETISTIEDVYKRQILYNADNSVNDT